MEPLLAIAGLLVCWSTLKLRLTECASHFKQRKATRRFAMGVHYAHDLLAGRFDAEIALRRGIPVEEVRLDERLVYIRARLEESCYLGHRDTFDQAVEQVIRDLPSTFVERSY